MCLFPSFPSSKDPPHTAENLHWHLDLAYCLLPFSGEHQEYWPLITARHLMTHTSGLGKGPPGVTFESRPSSPLGEELGGQVFGLKKLRLFWTRYPWFSGSEGSSHCPPRKREHDRTISPSPISGVLFFVIGRITLRLRRPDYGIPT